MLPQLHTPSLFRFASPRIYNVAPLVPSSFISQCTMTWTCARWAAHICRTPPSFSAFFPEFKSKLLFPRCLLTHPSTHPHTRSRAATLQPARIRSRYLSFGFRVAPSAMKSNVSSASKRAQTYGAARRHSRSLHWLFRSNIPRRRNSALPVDIRKRNFFGMGDIMQVLVNVSPPTAPPCLFSDPQHLSNFVSLKKPFAL